MQTATVPPTAAGITEGGASKALVAVGDLYNHHWKHRLQEILLIKSEQKYHNRK